MLSSAVNTSVSWCQAHLPVEVAREKIPLVDTSLRLADAYGMPIVVKIDSAIDGVVYKGNHYVLSVRDKSAVAVETVQGVRDSLRDKEEGLRKKLDGLITEKRNDFVRSRYVSDSLDSGRKIRQVRRECSIMLQNERMFDDDYFP
ncbi:Histone deacetylase complex subunit sap18 [Perkinsus olseni]|uniref:Histone deacetylase complex subunit sap18 n=1 Tax=Perkinsus olseni TaxID=32597 RepID=A0A7J6TNC9_PEROL|nr:Histone deacetylase complex subunit sap18 [Perkinsus olseni]